MSIEQLPVGVLWHHSNEKAQFDALIVRKMGNAAHLLTSSALQLLRPHGYKIFTQTRIGYQGKPFDMLKLQTMPSTTEKLRANVVLVPAAKVIRLLAFDELVQILHVSSDPEQAGPMAIIGPRPQMSAELKHMESIMCRHGKKERFDAYYKAYCAMRPGLFSAETIAIEPFEPNTLEYYEARIGATLWYYEHASAEVDTMIFNTMLALGNYRHQRMGRV